MHAHARLVGDSDSSRGSYRLVCARVGVNAWVEWWVWPCVGSEGVFLGAVCVPLMVRFARGVVWHGLGWLCSGCVVLYISGWWCAVDRVDCQRSKRLPGTDWVPSGRETLLWEVLSRLTVQC